MRTVPTEMTEAWLAEDKTGERRPTVRATIQYVNTAAFVIRDTSSVRNVRSQVNSVLFGQPADVLEIPGIESVSWSRGVTQDVAECTLTLAGSELTPIGQVGPDQDLYDDPGALVPSRGTIYDANPWNFVANGWEDVFVPDRLVRTYEGYGSDPNVAPALDPNLKSSGVWLIDDATFGRDGTVTLSMRDVGRLLVDQVVVFPTVPYGHYPLTFATKKNINQPANIPHNGKWAHPYVTSVSHSGTVFIGKNIVTSDGTDFVASNGVWSGNDPRNVLNGDDQKVWISTGAKERNPDGPKVWMQFNLKNTKTTIAGVRVDPVGGEYVCYISLYDSVKGKWLGTKKIPNNRPTEGYTTNAAINYNAAFGIHADKATDFVYRKPMKNISAVRLTFRPGNQIGSDELHPWRAGVREVFLYTGSAKSLSVTAGTQSVAVGNITDYTDAVKMLLGWAGFFWPKHDTNGDYQMLDDQGNKQFITYVSPDSQFFNGAGRIWGDFMDAGTGPVADLTPDLFDKQPFMDAIAYIRDVLGFVAFVDETGGFIWRMPNIWTPGNYLSADDLDPRSSTRSTEVIELKDENVLLDYSTTLSSKNLREGIIVANTDGRYVSLVGGYARILGVDFRRFAGYLDQHFSSQAEVNTMADMIATKQKFSYRSGKALIPGYPAIQVDDQVRIYDRNTNETFYHYVRGISSQLDMKNGTWTYSLDTHWLGEQATGSWVIDVNNITSDLFVFLHNLGVI